MALVSYTALPDDMVRRAQRVAYAPQRRPIDGKSSGGDIRRAFGEAGDTIPWVAEKVRVEGRTVLMREASSSADPDFMLLDPEAYRIEDADKAWFVMQVAPTHGASDRVRRLAKMRGYVVYWPRQVEIVVKGRGDARKNVPIVTPLYPRYVLVHMPASGTLKTTLKGEPTIGAPWGADFGRMTDAEARFYGVSGFLRSLDGPLAVPDCLVSRIVTMERDGAFRPRSSRVVGAFLDWQFVGALVRVLDGPFASFNAVIEALDAVRQRAKVSVNIFGRASLVDIELAQLGSVM